MEAEIIRNAWQRIEWGFLHQSCAPVGKLALIKQQRYAHAKQFKRANQCLRSWRLILAE